MEVFTSILEWSRIVCLLVLGSVFPVLLGISRLATALYLFLTTLGSWKRVEHSSFCLVGSEHAGVLDRALLQSLIAVR